MPSPGNGTTDAFDMTLRSQASWLSSVTSQPCRSSYTFHKAHALRLLADTELSV